MEVPFDWLQQGPPWVKYHTRLDLLERDPEDEGVQTARKVMVEHLLNTNLMRDLSQWPGYPLKRHNDAKHPLHKLVFLADMGLRASDPGMERIIDRILANRSPEGPFQIRMHMYKRFGGLEGEHNIWMMCDAPLVIYGLVRMGMTEEPTVQAGLEHLIGKVRENGWPCIASERLGKFKGPGSRDDPCPYANLAMLRALSVLPDEMESQAARIGVETLLDHWEHRQKKRPFLFGIGSDFVKLKLPLVWYDILHVAEVLTRFSWACQDERLKEMVKSIAEKADEEGCFTPESIYLSWRGWDFAQKRKPSYTMTMMAHRIMKRMVQ